MATSGLRDPLWRDPGFDLVIFYLPAERGTRQSVAAAAKIPAERTLHTRLTQSPWEIYTIRHRQSIKVLLLPETHTHTLTYGSREYNCIEVYYLGRRFASLLPALTTNGTATNTRPYYTF